MRYRTLAAYWNDIPFSKDRAVTYPELSRMWEMKERECRRILHELSRFDIGDGFVLIRSSKQKGFYKTDDKDEIAAYRQEMYNKGRSLFSTLGKMDKILKLDTRQYSFINNMRLIREDRGMKQSEVCEKMKDFDKHFDVSLLSKMENGICMPFPAQIAKLSEIYGCNPEELIKTDLYM